MGVLFCAKQKKPCCFMIIHKHPSSLLLTTFLQHVLKELSLQYCFQRSKYEHCLCFWSQRYGQILLCCPFYKIQAWGKTGSSYVGFYSPITERFAMSELISSQGKGWWFLANIWGQACSSANDFTLATTTAPTCTRAIVDGGVLVIWKNWQR